MMTRRVGAVWLVLPLILGACSAKTTAAPTSSTTTTPVTAPPTTVAVMAATTATTAGRASTTVARNAVIVSAEMALAGAKAGAVERGYFLERLYTEDSCRACIGSTWFDRWCATSGGRIVGTSTADGRYFADGGPVYCYPGAKALPALNLTPYVPGPRAILTAVECIEPGRRGPPFTVPAPQCPSGATSLDHD